MCGISTRRVGEERLHLAAEQVGQRRGGAAVGHVDELGAGRALIELHREVRG
jgi:hypothetical protein